MLLIKVFSLPTLAPSSYCKSWELQQALIVVYQGRDHTAPCQGEEQMIGQVMTRLPECACLKILHLPLKTNTFPQTKAKCRLSVSMQCTLLSHAKTKKKKKNVKCLGQFQVFCVFFEVQLAWKCFTKPAKSMSKTTQNKPLVCMLFTLYCLLYFTRNQPIQQKSSVIAFQNYCLYWFNVVQPHQNVGAMCHCYKH